MPIEIAEIRPSRSFKTPIGNWQLEIGNDRACASHLHMAKYNHNDKPALD
jgi:hypothetical protein